MQQGSERLGCVLRSHSVLQRDDRASLGEAVAKSGASWGPCRQEGEVNGMGLTQRAWLASVEGGMCWVPHQGFLWRVGYARSPTWAFPWPEAELGSSRRQEQSCKGGRSQRCA